MKNKRFNDDRIHRAYQIYLKAIDRAETEEEARKAREDYEKACESTYIP